MAKSFYEQEVLKSFGLQETEETKEIIIYNGI